MKRLHKSSIEELVALRHLSDGPNHLSAGVPRAHDARILHAEDDDALREMCRHVLKREGYSVLGVSNGIDAWRAVEKQDFDLIITDHEMPGCTGYELISKLRHEHIHWPVIVTTADGDPFRGHTSQWLDVAAILEKPFGIKELTATIAGLVWGGGIQLKT